MNSSQRRQAAMRRKAVSDSTIPALAGTVIRKGKARQKIGMWGSLDMYYSTPSLSTHDRRYDQTISNNG